MAVAVMLVGLSTAQAADTTLTLACQGTVTLIKDGRERKPEPISMGMIANLTAQTITGLGGPGDDTPMTITGFDDLHISFRGSAGNWWTIQGSIDRVTGDMEAISTNWELTTHEVAFSQLLALKCRPTQRMF